MKATFPTKVLFELWQSIRNSALLPLILFCVLLIVNPGCANRVPSTGLSTDHHSPAHSAGSADHSMRQGRHAFQRGAFDQAASRWREAARMYAGEGRTSEQCEALVLLARAEQSLGLHSGAIQTLEEALKIARKMGHRKQLAMVLGDLGDAHIVVGPGEQASSYLNEGLAMARELGDPQICARILNNMGNLHTSAGRYDAALACYLESAVLVEEASDPLLSVTAYANAASAALHLGHPDRATAFLEKGSSRLEPLEPSHEKVFRLIGMGLSASRVQDMLSNDRRKDHRQARNLLLTALSDAQTLDDQRAASFAMGYLGELSEKQRKYDEALQWTENAVLAARQADAPEALYRWQWQAARILKAQGEMEKAMEAYREAVQTLQSIREETTQCYGAPRISFREVAGPLYLEFVDMLLDHAGSITDPARMESQLLEAREAVELFKVYELRDYYRDECVDAARREVTRLDEVSREAVIIYPIILPNRLELLVSFPSGLKRFSVPVPADVLAREVRSFRTRLEKLTTREYLPHAQVLYGWLMGPLEAELQGLQINSLVFVPDGPLRSIPLAALHDGNRFLIQKYPLAVTPGLNLTEPRPMPRVHSTVLAAGLTIPAQGFPPLPHVKKEIEAIGALYEGERLLDEDFVLNRMVQVLSTERVTILHIASHGVFSGDVNGSFLLTYDGRLTLDRLDETVGLFRFRETPLELLTLSGCDTAAGDDRAALGLAGLAVKAGARSALATLWHINDEASSALVADFYGEVRKPGMSRARALQHAQLKTLKDPRYSHPGYWAPFLLINNWL